MVTQTDPRSYNIIILIYFHSNNSKLGLPKLRKETNNTFIFLSISSPENKRW